MATSLQKDQILAAMTAEQRLAYNQLPPLLQEGYMKHLTQHHCDGCTCGCKSPATQRVGATGEALEASKAVLLAAQGAVKAAEEAVAAAAEADFCGKAVLLAAQGAVKAAEEAVAAAAEADYFSCIGRL